MRLSAIFVLLAAILSGGDRSKAVKRLPWEKDPLRKGQVLYRENCVVCHDIDTADTKKLGPSFYRLFKRTKMPIANAAPSREYIAVRIRFGGKVMPAFRTSLNEREIASVIDYIASK